TDFGISVLVTSHLLGELERISDHVVVIDGGRLLRSSSTSEFTRTSRTLVVEVTDQVEAVAAALTDAGAKVERDRRLLAVELSDDADYDLIRSTVARLGVGLIRLEQRRHHIVEVFGTCPVVRRGARRCRRILTALLRASSTTSGIAITTATGWGAQRSPGRCSGTACAAPTDWDARRA